MSAKISDTERLRRSRSTLQAVVGDQWWGSQAVCTYLGINPASLYRIAKEDSTFPRGSRFEKRAVRWRRSDIEKWAESKQVAS